MIRGRRAIIAMAVLAIFSFTVVTNDQHASAAATWTSRANDAPRKWITLFASDDGTKLIGTIENGTLMRSSNSGATWTSVTSLGNQNWHGVFGTPDGQKIIATVARGPVFLSNDGGVNWTEVTSVGSRWWSDGAMSADGQHIMFVGNADMAYDPQNVGYVYQSSNGGTSWNLTNIATYPSSATMSRDGRYRAFGEYSKKLYTSSDYGATWTMRESGVDRYYTELTSSNSGQYMYAATLYDKILKSSDYGVTWTQIGDLPDQTYRNVRTSADGKRVIASAQDGFVYASDNFGVAWRSSWDDAQRSWFASAMSRDGSKVFAAEYDGYLYDRDFFGDTAKAPSVTAVATPGQRKSIDVSWPAVPNVSSFTVTLYDAAGSQVLETFTGVAGNATSFTITTADYAGLADSTTYRVSVTAAAAATQYGGEFESAKVSVTTGPVSAPTTTTTTTTTTTVVPSSTTTVAQAAQPSSSSSSNASSTTSVPLGQKDVAAVSATTVPPTSTTSTTSSTTVAPLISNQSGSTNNEVTAPNAPEVAPGSARAIVDGEVVDAAVTRENNALVMSAGSITATISGVSPEGDRISLDADGNLRLEENDFVQVEATGYGANESVDIWMFSTPTRIGTATANSDGKISARFTLPEGLETGNHRVVLDGVNQDGTPVVLGIGLKFGAAETTSTATRVLIAIPIALAVAAGFILPTTIRRRRRATV